MGGCLLDDIHQEIKGFGLLDGRLDIIFLQGPPLALLREAPRPASSV